MVPRLLHNTRTLLRVYRHLNHAHLHPTHVEVILVVTTRDMIPHHTLLIGTTPLRLRPRLRTDKSTATGAMMIVSVATLHQRDRMIDHTTPPLLNRPRNIVGEATTIPLLAHRVVPAH